MGNKSGLYTFGLLFRKFRCLIFFQFQKKRFYVDKNKLNISIFQTSLWNVCLSSVCGQPSAYNSLCRQRLGYITKKIWDTSRSCVYTVFGLLFNLCDVMVSMLVLHLRSPRFNPHLGREQSNFNFSIKIWITCVFPNQRLLAKLTTWQCKKIKAVL